MSAFTTDMEDTTFKVPPQNIEAEQSVLGAVLIENNAIYKAIELVNSNDFYKEAHRRIFLAMIELSEKNDAIDLITLTEYLHKKNELDSVAVGTVWGAHRISPNLPTQYLQQQILNIIPGLSVRRRL